MASIHKLPNCKNWIAAFYLPDGRRTMRSTGTPNKRKALQVCMKFEEAARLGREGRLTESRVRSTMADMFAMANAAKMPNATLAEYLESWIKRKSLEVSESSAAAYQRTCELLQAALPQKRHRAIEAVTVSDAAHFRDTIAAKVSAATANKNLKIARVIWGDAMRDGLTQDNPFAKVKRLKAASAKRRAFSLDELRRILEVCSIEWKGMVLFGLYSGQRLADLVGLTWANIDLQSKEIHLTTGKTGRPMHIPLAAPLMAYVMDIPTPDSPTAPLFPKLSTISTRTLSNQFNGILATAGLVAKRNHQSMNKGRDVKRNVGGPSFHCLRHTATSLLKNAGVSDVVAREIIGHESEAVSRTYTHIETNTLRAAVEKMPDITKE